jgi:hypothetical protein
MATMTVAAALAAAVCPSVASAVFTDSKTNLQTLQAAGTFPVALHMVSGSYVGDGTTGRVIKAMPFKPDLVIVRGETNQPSVARTSTMTGDQTKPLVGALVLATNHITSLNADGFTVGSSARVNTSAITYHWVALQNAAGIFKVGSYVGDGTSGRDIIGLGFGPEYVAVLGAGSASAVQRYGSLSNTYQFDADAGGTEISALYDIVGLQGFELSNTVEVNSAGSTYHWFAFNDSPGAARIGSYTGDGTDNRNITGIGFQPSYTLVRAESASSLTPRAGVQRFASLSGDSSFPFGAVAASSNLVQALSSDGFQVGSDPAVNEKAAFGSVKFGYSALRNTASPCPQQGTYTMIGPRDTWVDQANPTATNATDRSLRVRSSAGANRRGLLRFTTPSGLDPDCVVKSAQLVLTSTSATGGRTLQAWLAGASWTSAATWNSQPATTGTAVSAPSAGTNGATVTFDVTAQVRSLAAGTVTNNGWIIRDATEGDAGGVAQVFASSENPVQDPQLTVVIGP